MRENVLRPEELSKLEALINCFHWTDLKKKMTPSVSVQTYLKLNLEDLVFFSDIYLLILDAPQRLHNSTTIS